MELSQYLFFLLQEAIRLYWAAFLYNPGIYLVWLWNRKTVIPLDLGANFSGKRLIGDSRSFDGLLLSIAFGITGVFITASYIPFFASVGANFGTVVSSFVKRRLGFTRGRHAWLIDEFDFIAGAALFVSFIEPFNPGVFVFAAACAFILHNAANLWVRPKLD